MLSLPNIIHLFLGTRSGVNVDTTTTHYKMVPVQLDTGILGIGDGPDHMAARSGSMYMWLIGMAFPSDLQRALKFWKFARNQTGA